MRKESIKWYMHSIVSMSFKLFEQIFMREESVCDIQRVSVFLHAVLAVLGMVDAMINIYGSIAAMFMFASIKQASTSHMYIHHNAVCMYYSEYGCTQRSLSDE